MPSAFPLFLPWNSVAITAGPFAIIIDAPSASMHLDIIKIVKLGEIVQNIAPVANMKKPVAYTLFFGYKSPILPKNGRNTVITSIYAIIIHCTFVNEIFNP